MKNSECISLNARAGTGLSVGMSSLLKNEKFYSLLVLFLLLTTAFFPLLFRKNFLPFEGYPSWSVMLALSSGQALRLDHPAAKRLAAMNGVEEPEVGSLAINWPDNVYFARKLKSGHLPLWDPYTGGGVPIIDNGQSRPFNPFRLPFYFFPTTWVYSLTLLAGLVFGGIGAYLWLSKQGLSAFAVTLGTGLFVFNPWVLERLVLTDSAAYFVLPWCLITLKQAVWRNWPSIGRAVLCFVLMGHCGHPEASVIMAALAVAVSFFSERRSGNSERAFTERAKTIGTVAAFTFVCLTLLWLPLLRLLAIGDIYKRHAWFVYEYRWSSLITLPSDMFMVPAIVGVLACTPLAWRRVPKVWVVLFTTVVLVLFPLPWIGTLLSRLLSYHWLPSFYLKGIFWASLSFLVPYGLDAYRASRKSSVIPGLGISAALLALTGWQFKAIPMARADISAFPITAFLLLALGLLALVFFHTTKNKFFHLFMCAIVLAPLAFPLSLNKLLWNTIDFKTNSVIEWLKTNRPNARTVSVDHRHVLAIPPNLGQAYGIRCSEVIAVIFLNNYWSMFHQPKASISTLIGFNYYFPGVFKHMGASILLLANDVSSSGLDLLIKGSHFSAYSIPGAHGRLYFAEQARQYKPGADFPSQIVSLSRDTDAVAVVEGIGTPVPQVIPEIPSGRGKAVFEQEEDDKVLVRTECPMEGLLVLRDSWYPGWLALIDGKRVPVFRINGCFRGVIVPAGEHMVRFVYRPIVVYVAGIVSLIATLLVIVISVGKGLSGTVGRFYRE